MKVKKRPFLGRFNRFRLMLTLGLAVLLPAAGLILVNFMQLRSFERDKVLEAAIHRDFQDYLYLTEKKMNQTAYAMTEEIRDSFPLPDDDVPTKEKKLDSILSSNPKLVNVFIYNEQCMTFRTQPGQLSDKYVHEEH